MWLIASMIAPTKTETSSSAILLGETKYKNIVLLKT